MRLEGTHYQNDLVEQNLLRDLEMPLFSQDVMVSADLKVVVRNCSLVP